MDKCVCCEQETNGSYGNKFPVCYHCYFVGKLTTLFHMLAERQTIKINPTMNKYTEPLIVAAQEWAKQYVKKEE